MSNFWRNLFGANGSAGSRSVVGGSPEGIDLQDVSYIRESNRRLTALQELYARYKGSPHAQQIREVQEKTTRIHKYLVGRKRLHELELFHLQHTDHFLNTFTVIMDVHQQHLEQEIPLPPPPPVTPTKKDVVGRTLVFGPFRSDRKEVKAARMQNRETSQQAFSDITEANIEVPRLSTPQISISTYSKIIYLKEVASDGLTSNEIGFTSTTEEKDAFVTYVAARLGLEGISYVGNAMVYLPTQNSTHPAEMVPVIHWNGSPYVLHLEDYRLFPVTTYRKTR